VQDQTGGNPLSRVADLAKVPVTMVAGIGDAVGTLGSVATGFVDAVFDSGKEDTHNIRGCRPLHSATECDDEDDPERESERE